MQSDNLRDRVLVKLLSKMKPSEREGLKVYLNCGLFNSSQIMLILLDLIETRILTARKQQIGSEEFLQDVEIKPSRLNKLFTHLFQLTNEYLELMERRNNSNEGYRFLFQAYSKLGVDESLKRKVVKKAMNGFQKLPQGQEALQMQYQVAHVTNLDHIHTGRRKVPAYFVENQKLLDQYYVTARLKYLCATRNMEWIYNLEREDLGESEIVLLYKGLESEQPLLAQAYFLALQIFTKKEVEGLIQLQQFLQENGDDLPRPDLLDLWGYLLNYCIRRMLSGDLAYQKITDSIYLHLLEKGYLLENGKLSSFHFINIIKLRLGQKQSDWVKEFIHEMDGELVNDFDGAIIKYSWGLWHYNSGNFRDAITIFKELLFDPPKDIFWNLDLRGLLWKSYFEHREGLTDYENDEMEALYDSFRVFVARNENIPTSSRRSYQNFIRFFNRFRLIIEGISTTKDGLQMLKAEIEKAPEVNSKKWLLENLNKFL